MNKILFTLLCPIFLLPKSISGQFINLDDFTLGSSYSYSDNSQEKINAYLITYENREHELLQDLKFKLQTTTLDNNSFRFHLIHSPSGICAKVEPNYHVTFDNIKIEPPFTRIEQFEFLITFKTRNQFESFIQRSSLKGSFEERKHSIDCFTPPNEKKRLIREFYDYPHYIKISGDSKPDEILFFLTLISDINEYSTIEQQKKFEDSLILDNYIIKQQLQNKFFPQVLLANNSISTSEYSGSINLQQARINQNILSSKPTLSNTLGFQSSINIGIGISSFSYNMDFDSFTRDRYVKKDNLNDDVIYTFSSGRYSEISKSQLLNLNLNSTITYMISSRLSTGIAFDLGINFITKNEVTTKSEDSYRFYTKTPSLNMFESEIMSGKYSDITNHEESSQSYFLSTEIGLIAAFNASQIFKPFIQFGLRSDRINLLTNYVDSATLFPNSNPSYTSYMFNGQPTWIKRPFILIGTSIVL